MKYAIIDIETNMAHDTIWCVGYRTPDMEKAAVAVTAAALPSPLKYNWVAHNGVSFDFPLLAKLWNWEVPLSQQTDTLLMSRMYDTNIANGHSLKAWGQRLELDDGKLEFTDFDGGYTQEMADYCARDVDVLHAVYVQLEKAIATFTPSSIRMEHAVRSLTDAQETNGFKLDASKASSLYAEAAAQRGRIEERLQEVFPAITHKRVSEKTGKELKDRVEVFNPGSRTQIAARLATLGVKWSKFTEKGNIIVDETTLKTLKQPEAALCLDYLTLGKKASMVEGWLKHVQDDGRVHGRVNTLGAVTARMTHSSPNVAQVDSDPDMRQCWTVDDGNVLVGVDAAGLELRMLAHYMDDAEYTSLILDGDIHTYNQEAAGLDTRDQAKTFIYAMLYGAGDAKIGSITGGTGKQGRRMREDFEAAVPAYAKLKAKVERIAEQGTLPGLDGRRIRVRHAHAALNSLLQSAGAIVMKRALVIGSNRLLNANVPYRLVAQVHDEMQCEVEKRYSHIVGAAFVGGIKGAGRYYQMRCPLDGEAKIGLTWAGTH